MKYYKIIEGDCNERSKYIPCPWTSLPRELIVEISDYTVNVKKFTDTGELEENTVVLLEYLPDHSEQDLLEHGYRIHKVSGQDICFIYKQKS